MKKYPSNNRGRNSKNSHNKNFSKNQKKEEDHNSEFKFNRIKRSEYPNKVYYSSKANNWNNLTYKFKSNHPNSSIRVIPVNGLEMVGTNCTIIENENDLIIIDVGLGFPEDNLLGIDALTPNLSYLYDKLDKLRGIIVTHGHTDHIGAIPYLYERIGSPMIYAPKLAAEIIKEKFKDLKIIHKLKIQEINDNSIYYLGKFRISHFRMNHTIMDNFGVCIDTPIGKIVHTSDYKFDFTPYKEPPSDYSKLTKIGDEGVLLLLDESTNVKIPGWAPSETAIAYDLENVIRDANGRLIIGLFSTMISRIRQISEISEKYRKKVAVLGKSLSTNIKISHRLNYIDVNKDLFINVEDIDKYPDDSIVILATGSQGEPNAALMRIANGEHSNIKLKRSDTIVLSSSKIPGNEQKIQKLINLISDKGCKVLTNENLTLHSTGHGFSEDHKLMLQLTKPKFIMPIHGEQSMLIANRENAMRIGYKSENIILLSDGDIVEITPNNWRIIGNTNSKPLWLENEKIIDYDEQAINDRKIISEEGIIICAIKYENNKQYNFYNVSFVRKGLILDNFDEIINKKLAPSIIENLNKLQGSIDNHNPNNIKTSTISIIKQFFKKEFSKSPLIEVIVI